MNVFDAAMIDQLQAHRPSSEAAAEMRAGGRLVARLAGVLGAIALIILALDQASPVAFAGAAHVDVAR